jgi:hypothetical protein
MMPCFHPLTAYRHKSGPQKNGKWPITFKAKEAFTTIDGKFDNNKLQLPCGRCIGCRIERTRQWAVRCVLESRYYKRNCFITLTYDNEHLPKDKSVKKEDLRNFIKRLRKRLEKYYEISEEGVPKKHKIKYFGCGEYGEHYSRPHYHVAIFGYDFSDKTAEGVIKDVRTGGELSWKGANGSRTEGERSGSTSRKGPPLKQSIELEKMWGKGFCSVGELNFDTAQYIAKYVTKKLTKEYINYYGGRSPEFGAMSKNIGKDFYMEFKNDITSTDRIILNRRRSIKPPVFYDRLIELDDLPLYEKIKNNRKEKLNKEEYTPERLKAKELCMKQKLKQKKRTYEND